MKNLNSFDQYSLNEKATSSFIKSLLKKTDDKERNEHMKRVLQTLSRRVDLSRITDVDIQELSDPKVITKKPYTDGNYMIVVFGDKEIWVPSNDDVVPKIKSHYRTIKDIPMFIIEGTDVTDFSPGRGRNYQSPNRKNLIDTKGLKFYALKVGDKKKDDDWWGSAHVQKLRSKRNMDKANANMGTDRENYNDRQLAVNKARYAEQLKKIKSYDYLFDRIKELMKEVVEEEQVIPDLYKTMCKTEISPDKWREYANNLSDAFKVPETYLKELGEFDNTFKYGSDMKGISKSRLLGVITRELADKLNPNHKISDAEMEQVKMLPNLLKKFPKADIADLKDYVETNIWADSEQLKGANKKLGVFDND